MLSWSDEVSGGGSIHDWKCRKQKTELVRCLCRRDTVVREIPDVWTVGKNTVAWSAVLEKYARWRYALEIRRIEVERENEKWNVFIFETRVKNTFLNIGKVDRKSL